MTHVATHEANHSDPNYTGRLLRLRSTAAYREWELVHRIQLNQLVADAKSYMHAYYEPRLSDRN